MFPKEALTLKADYINPIYKASRDVFTNVLGWDVQKGEIQLVQEIHTRNKMNVSIGITGELKGIILFSFPEGMVLEILEEMSRNKFDRVDKFAIFAVGELAKIISENAILTFKGNGYQCESCPPQITIGDIQIYSTAMEKALWISLKTRRNAFDLFISIDENKKESYQ